MALITVQFTSQVLQVCTPFQVVLPDEGELSEAPVVYLLHGLTGNCTSWTRFTPCERYARERGAALVMPEVQRSFYLNEVYGLDYFTYVAEELPAVVHRMFGLSLTREKNFVMGLSMGGYGALKCALTAPERYAGCGSFSGVTDFAARCREIDEPGRLRELTALVGLGHTPSPSDDLFQLTDRAVELPPIYLSCGEQDAHYEMNREFAARLEARGAAYRFDHRPGGHTWDFWDQSLQDCLDYLLPRP